MLDPTAVGIVHPGVFCAAVALLNATPGPDTAFIVGQSAAHGRRAGLMAVLGISAGCVVHTIALALGLSAILAASASAFFVIKAVGAAYLVFLGVRLIVGSFRGPPLADSAAMPPPRSSALRTFAQGFATNVLNPKVVLFFLSFIPQFVDANSPSKTAAFVVLGAVLVAISTVYNGAVAWIAGTVTHRLRAAPRTKAWLDRFVGTAFVALGARIAVGDR